MDSINQGITMNISSEGMSSHTMSLANAEISKAVCPSWNIIIIDNTLTIGIEASTAAIRVLLSEIWAIEKMIRAVSSILPASKAQPMGPAGNLPFSSFSFTPPFDTNTYANQCEMPDEGRPQRVS